MSMYLLSLAAWTFSERLLVGVVMAIWGGWMIWTGKRAVASQTAEQEGKARIYNWLMGKSNTYTGEEAVTYGKRKILAGWLAIGIAIFFVIFGPVLAD